MKRAKLLRAARIAHIAIWSLIALIIIISTCVVWEQNGCGAFSIIAAIAFYISACTGICLVGDFEFQDRIKEEEK